MTFMYTWLNKNNIRFKASYGIFNVSLHIHIGFSKQYTNRLNPLVYMIVYSATATVFKPVLYILLY